MKMINDNFQNRKKYNIPKAQLVLTDIPYNIGINAYGSNPKWYKGGDNKNGESELAGKQFFDTDKSFNLVEFFHFCNKLIKPEPKKTGDAGCMIVFCAFEQLHMLIEVAKRYGFPNYINLNFYKNYSPQVLKANMRIVGNTEYALLLYRNKLPKFNNNGRMIFNSMPMPRDTETPKIHPCLPAGQKVFFNNEWINIENVKVGDKNRYGTVTYITNHNAERLIEIEVGKNKTIATWNHPFLIEKNKKVFWINAEDIKKGDNVLTLASVYNTLKPLNKKGLLWNRRLQKKAILEHEKTKMENLEWSIISFGKKIMGKFQQACRFIIETTTRQIISFPISSLSHPLNIKGYTLVADLSTMNGKSHVKFVESLKSVLQNFGIIQEVGLMGESAKSALSKNKLEIEKFVLQKVGSVKNIETNIKVYNLTMNNIPAFDTEIGVSHNTQKPIEMLKDLIRIFTDKGDVVIDPCAGSGTTLLASKALGRPSYGFEIKKPFVKDFNEKLAVKIPCNLF